MSSPSPKPEQLPSSAPLDLEEVHRVTRFLEAIIEDRALLAPLGEEDRKALLRACGMVAMPERDAKQRLARAAMKLRKETSREKDREIRNTAQIRTLRKAPVFTAPALPPGEIPRPAETEQRVLEKPRNCYVCKGEYRVVHFFYDSMCTPCGDFNYAKRFQRADLRGKVALITGGRVKIGYQASLLLLRSGAHVIATTRFPHDAALRYVKEPDFAEWGHRLEIHGLDLRHAPSVELFAKFLERKHARLDILINNAAQTVRRPPGFYGHLLQAELEPTAGLDAQARSLLRAHEECVEALDQVRQLGAGAAGHEGAATRVDAAMTASWKSHDPSLGIRASAALSQLPYAMEQEGDVERLFPTGRLHADLQQVDLREVHSWRLTLGELQTAEMLEVHLVNAVAPFILCSKLKGLMLRDRERHGPGHIVNVSAMEGVFSRGTKTDKHPHTNMAKAALNMMTLTSAPDYARSGLYMNAVDTGWVTDEDPAQHAERKVKELDFQPPLDIVDGASRIVDPVFEAARTGECVWGNFFKDYRPASW